MAEVEEQPVAAEEPTFEAEDEFVPSSATDVKLYGKWSFDDIEVRDISLEVRQTLRNTYQTRTNTTIPNDSVRRRFSARLKVVLL